MKKCKTGFIFVAPLTAAENAAQQSLKLVWKELSRKILTRWVFQKILLNIG